MKELELNELKQVAFDTLKVFDAFCKENNIRYYLAYGTLLGAIRYKKFIPWDDDVDVLVPRDDYKRLLTSFQDSEKYKLFAYEKDERFCFPFAKLCDMTTRKIEILPTKDLELGVDIDIFPLDAWNSDYDKAKKEATKIQRDMFWLNASKLDSPPAKNPIKWVAWGGIIIAGKLFGSKYFTRKIVEKSITPPCDGATYMGSKSWCVYGAKGIIPAEAFANAVEIEFEGEMFPAPVGYDTYLTCLYGDYLPEPPVEKRKTHHTFKAYRL